MSQSKLLILLALFLKGLIDLFHGLLQAVDVLHSNGCVHGGISLRNVLIKRENGDAIAVLREPDFSKNEVNMQITNSQLIISIKNDSVTCCHDNGHLASVKHYSLCLWKLCRIMMICLIWILMKIILLYLILSPTKYFSI